MVIELTNSDYQAIANMIASSQEYDEQTSEIVESNNMLFEVHFKKSVQGYVEDDYYNGTGAWVCTSADVSLYDIICLDEGIEVSYNSREIEDLAEMYIED